MILENTFTSILDMAGVMLPILKWFIGGTGGQGLRVLNFLVRSPWNTVDIIKDVCFLWNFDHVFVHSLLVMNSSCIHA